MVPFFNLSAGLGSCIEASFMSGWKCQNDSTVLADRRVLEVHVIFDFDCKFMCLSKDRSQMRQFSAI